MASVVWLSVFILLCVELVITFILVVPLPAVVRRGLVRGIRAIKFGSTVRFAAKWVFLMLAGAVVESVTTLQRLQARERDPAGAAAAAAAGGLGDPRAGYVEMSFEKQRKFRAERNLYLSGFALTLLLVIARIVELMQEGVVAEDARDEATRRLDDVASTAAATGNPIPDGSNKGSSGSSLGLRQRAKAN